MCVLIKNIIYVLLVNMLPGVSPCARVWLVLIKCACLALDIFIPRVARVGSGIKVCLHARIPLPRAPRPSRGEARAAMRVRGIPVCKRCEGDTQCDFTWVGAPVR